MNRRPIRKLDEDRKASLCLRRIQPAQGAG